MTDQTPRSVAALRLDTEVGAALQRHLAVRVERVVATMAPTFAGRPMEDVVGEMQVRLRGLGVNLPPRLVEGYARLIANLPPTAAA